MLGLLVGAALGLAGALMQALTRNPLADPGLLGVNAGAALAIVVAIAAVRRRRRLGTYVWFAFAGAGGRVVLVYRLGARDAAARRRSGSRSPARRSRRR